METRSKRTRQRYDSDSFIGLSNPAMLAIKNISFMHSEAF